MAAITTAVSDGSLTVDEAAQLARLFETYVKAATLHDITNRLEALESRIKATE
jgi:hypothetical protein